MPKSKRSHVVALTKVKKKSREWKEAIFQKTHKLCDDYPRAFVFKYYNMRNDRFKEFREDHKDSSTFMLASTKKVAAALGRSREDEYLEGLHELTPHLRGHSGLLFTKLPLAEASAIIDAFAHDDFARAGARASHRVTLPPGPLSGPGGAPFPHTMEHTLRALGLPTKLNKGVIELVAQHTVRIGPDTRSRRLVGIERHPRRVTCHYDAARFSQLLVKSICTYSICTYRIIVEEVRLDDAVLLQICEEGRPLTANQATLLRHFDVKMATFKLKLKAVWEKASATTEVLDDEDDSDLDEVPGADAMRFEDALPAGAMLPEALR